MDPFDSRNSERANLPRNMIENSMFEEEPDVVDLAKDSTSFPSFPPLDPDDVAYEPRSSRLLVRGLGENDLDDEEEDCESSARLLGMSFMNRSSAQRVAASPYTRHSPSRSCSRPSARTMVVCVLLLVIVVSMTMVLYLLPECTFTKNGCPKQNKTSPSEPVYPISTNGEVFPWAQLRLPQSVRPLSYDLTLNPDLDKMTFTGHSVITMFVRHNTKHIVLHSMNLNINKATFKLGDEKATTVTVLEFKPKQQIAVKFTEELKAGQLCVLTIDYSANLSHTYDGFYNSSYTDKEGNKKVLAATQFEPLSARKAFPCFDEPSFKATFLIKISHKADYLALSNMPKAKTTKLSNGLVLDEFETTSVNMSTYLVAFIVANFTPVSKNVSNTLLSVYSVPEKKEHTGYALDAASKLLDFYNNFFEIPYPLQKLDLVAIPDFLAGAMENWGLITFRETSLLVGSHSSALEKQVVGSVVAHELAHQWFGNLVTMSWWNDLWLNEGFATYMQYTSIQNVLPELDIENLFLDVRLRAMEKDALNSSHAVSTEVNTPEQVEEMFDSVSYEKGASILLMLNASLPGDQQFRKGIIQYLKQFSGLNTYTNDLWNSLTQVELSSQHQNVSEMMSLWTSQKGFPLVTVSHKGDEVNLSQEHFLLTSDNATHSSSLWHIPVSYINNSCSLAAECRQLFTLKTKSETLKLPEKVKWLKLNYKNTGFYIVDYGKEGWSELSDALANNYQVLTSEDRTSLIHNIFSLSRLGRVSFHQVHQLLKYLSNETDTTPVTEALLQLNTIYRLLDKHLEHELGARLKGYILSLFGALIQNQTWGEIESVSKQELRSALLETACHFNEESCIKQAKDIFKNYVESNGTATIPGDLQQVVFNVAAQSDDWSTLLTLYGKASYDSEKRKMLKGLASTQNPQQIIWILQEGLRGQIVQTQELPLVIGTVCNGFAGYLFAWDFIQENWDRLIEKFPVGSFAIQRIIKSATSQFSTKTHLDQVQSFFSSLKERGSSMRSVQEALETIKLNQRWIDTNLASLRKCL
ncbi:leucyl-cystinyl aminopeptidase isoform X1 [Periophthalmus magnuspinnatus]|uniref:leucyl-cystinyl aminopeptidase isoform X1 n=2 Tax=Periophthalmus magnuspinnatus TaxID=409849 RepID=UPI00145ACBAC|nr:leucyl-cystinyl aminopeptidase isoform X1 [Periophthalmus magnuspinnatus]